MYQGFHLVLKKIMKHFQDVLKIWHLKRRVCFRAC